MTIDYTIMQDNDLTIVTASGSFADIHQIIPYLEDVIEAVRIGPSRRVLIDDRALLGTLDMFSDKLELATLIASHHDLKYCRWGALVNEEREFSAREFETLVRNRGYNFMVFDSEQAAREWLTA